MVDWMWMMPRGTSEASTESWMGGVWACAAVVRAVRRGGRGGGWGGGGDWGWAGVRGRGEGGMVDWMWMMPRGTSEASTESWMGGVWACAAVVRAVRRRRAMKGVESLNGMRAPRWM